MSGMVDRYTPSAAYPRLLIALVACSVPVTLFLFGSVVLINARYTAEAVQGPGGLVLAALFGLVLLSSHVAHVLVRDVADRARDEASSVRDASERAFEGPRRSTSSVDGSTAETESDRLLE